MKRWLKFNAVGGMGVVVQLAALALLASGLHLHYLAATALAVEAAILHNFLWHERYTWADRAVISRIESLKRLARFNLSTGMVSIISNVALMGLLAGRLRIPYLAANMIAIAAASLLNYLVSDRFVFVKSAVS